jgi:hypothetical protein
LLPIFDIFSELYVDNKGRFSDAQIQLFRQVFNHLAERFRNHERYSLKSYEAAGILKVLSNKTTHINIDVFIDKER